MKGSVTLSVYSKPQAAYAWRGGGFAAGGAAAERMEGTYRSELSTT